MRNIFSNKFYIRLIAITLCFFLAPSQSIAQLSSAGAAGSASHPGPPSPIGCTVGDSVVLVDNIGRDVSNGFGPLWVDRAPSDNTYGFLSMNNADEPSSVQTYVALSVVRAEHTVKLSAVEAVLAQAGPNGTGNANPFNLNATPANFAFLIYKNFEEVLTNPHDPFYKACFDAASTLYVPDPNAPLVFFNHRSNAKPNYLAGFDLDERVNQISLPNGASGCTTINQDIILQGGKEYLLALHINARFTADGFFGLASSRRPQQSVHSHDAWYDYSYPTNDQGARDALQPFPPDTPTAAYMAMGEITQCCTNRNVCPCKFPLDENHPDYVRWRDYCFPGNPDDYGNYNNRGSDRGDGGQGGDDGPYDTPGNFPDRNSAEVNPSGGSAGGNS